MVLPCQGLITYGPFDPATQHSQHTLHDKVPDGCSATNITPASQAGGGREGTKAERAGDLLQLSFLEGLAHL